MHQIKFGIIDSNILTGLGLQAILEDIIPVAEIHLLQSFDEIEKMDLSEFVHFFVSSRIYFEHAQFFRQQAVKSIVLVSGDMTINGVKTINICQNEKALVRDILALNRGHHGGSHPGKMPIGNESLTTHHSPVLTPREQEVAVLLAKGCINKEVADKLNVSLTTAISHRKNIMDKLHARSLADIIVYAVMNGLVEVSEL